MKFCEKCGSLLVVEKRTKNIYLVCRKCGRGSKANEKVEITETIPTEKKGIVVMGKDEGIGELPKTHIVCPKCEHGEAHWWMQQTRSADEPPTLFYKCVKCGYGWRSYG
jgi:DNA-directed RNA polymerase subunit M